MSLVSEVKKLVGPLSKAIGPLSLPSKAGVVLSLVAGGLQVANQAVFGNDHEVFGAVTALLVFGAGVGISPLVGAQFRAALKLSPKVAYIVSAVIAFLTVVLATVTLPGAVHAVLSYVLTTAAGLGFAPVVETAITTSKSAEVPLASAVVPAGK